ncbi:hypothetical protein AAT19DRAFT_8729 [Rhodotorula toruloides]|uniref:Uncharacterized protein n=1 Tax=Rhodotorula toruloides TaxID=5286 RepID=A0A2T0AI62_RHOTO|nr:hypothetical protein AAT19DRAFT_8729 [Rhodotorula toruloides]
MSGDALAQWVLRAAKLFPRISPNRDWHHLCRSAVVHTPPGSRSSCSALRIFTRGRPRFTSPASPTSSADNFRHCLACCASSRPRSTSHPDLRRMAGQPASGGPAQSRKGGPASRLVNDG